jgi:hypothetical protein
MLLLGRLVLFLVKNFSLVFFINDFEFVTAFSGLIGTPMENIQTIRVESPT